MEKPDWLAQSPEVNHIQRLWDELERCMCASQCLMSLMYSLAEWEQISAATLLQNLVERLSSGVESVFMYL